MKGVFAYWKINIQYNKKIYILYFVCFSGLGEIERFLIKQENSHNPFLENSNQGTSFLDIAVDILTTITSRRNSRKYALFKPHYKAITSLFKVVLYFDIICALLINIHNVCIIGQMECIC